MGWIKTDGGLYEPRWTTLWEASKTNYELIFAAARTDVILTASATKIHFTLQR